MLMVDLNGIDVYGFEGLIIFFRRIVMLICICRGIICFYCWEDLDKIFKVVLDGIVKKITGRLEN